MALVQKQAYRSVEEVKSALINARTHSQLIYNKGGRNIPWRKESLFNKSCWENWTATCKIMKLEDSLTPYKIY